MTYRVEYNGRDVEATTLDTAIEDAKNAIAADVGPVSTWTVEHDETINDWFVQGVINGSPVGSTAVIAGPEPTPELPAVPYRDDRRSVYRSSHAAVQADEREEWLRSITFTGITPAEVFGRATTWLAARPDAVTLSDVGWRAPSGGEVYELHLHYRDGRAG
jgi:hypothetical protein